MSHPTRVRGLKHYMVRSDTGGSMSHPTRVRGLKHQHHFRACCLCCDVAPHAGATVPCLYVKQGSLFLAKKGEKNGKKT